MISLLLAACLAMPSFDMTGVPCPSPSTECRCSECMKWDEVPGALGYDIVRQAGSGSWVIVGAARVYDVSDDEGVVIGQDPQELWCFAWDVPFPVEGVSHRYEVRAWNQRGISPWSPQTITYVAAAYACYAGTGEVPCYAGDPVVGP
jgi:hypothetical protein